MLTTTKQLVRLGAAVAVGVLSLTACGSDSETTDTTAAPTESVAADPVETTPSAAGALPGCDKASLQLKTKGLLTFATSKPAFPPWVVDDDPTNKKGFESAVAYAVAETLGFADTEVKWEFGTFDSLIAPGTKNYDVALNQFSITEERKAVVDFSRGYYRSNQAIVAFEDSPAAKATTLADLQKLKFGAQVATTSLQYLTDVVKPEQDVFQYSDNAAAKAALAAKQIDAIVVDLPTAFYISGVEIEGSKVVGQFPTGDQGEEFGMVLEKGSPLTQCVSSALAALEGSGRLGEIQTAELSGTSGVPIIK